MKTISRSEKHNAEPGKVFNYPEDQMHLLLTKKENSIVVELSITYEKPKGWFFKILPFLFAD